MQKWIRFVPSGLAVAFLLFDTSVKLIEASPAIQATTALGFSSTLVRPIGIIELICLALYVIPSTAGLGAILLTAYLGGAVASQLRAAAPLWSQTLFPVYVAVLVWGGLLLRDSRVRPLFPFLPKRATAQD